MEIDRVTSATLAAHETTSQESFSSFSPAGFASMTVDTMTSAIDDVSPTFEEAKSTWKKASDWLSWLGGALGISTQVIQSDTTAVEDKSNVEGVSGGIPKLESPREIDRAKLSELIVQMKEQIDRHLEEMQEFEQEMSRSDAHFDIKILEEQFRCSLKQKEAREESNALLQERALEKQRCHKELQTTYYDLKKHIADQEGMASILSWVNYGTTTASLGVLAGTLILGGPVMAAVGGVLALSKAGLTGFKWYLKKQEDSNKAELFVVKHHMDECTTTIKMNVSDMRTFMREMTESFKAIRAYLDSYYEATKMINR